MAPSTALIKLISPGAQRATLIVNGNEGINGVCITIDSQNAERVFIYLFIYSATWTWKETEKQSILGEKEKASIVCLTV